MSKQGRFGLGFLELLLASHENRGQAVGADGVPSLHPSRDSLVRFELIMKKNGLVEQLSYQREEEMVRYAPCYVDRFFFFGIEKAFYFLDFDKISQCFNFKVKKFSESEN